MRKHSVTDGADAVHAAVGAGENLVHPGKHPLLRGAHRSAVVRWILSGKLPALKVGSRYFTTDSLVREFVARGRTAPPTPSAEERHQKAMERIQAISRKGGGK